MPLVNYFSKPGFSVTSKGAVDNNTMGFLSYFSGRCGPGITAPADTASLDQLAMTVNQIIAEFVAQGWTAKGSNADEQNFSNAIRGVTMIPASTEWAYAPYEVFKDIVTVGEEIIETENGFSISQPAPGGGAATWTPTYSAAAAAGRIGGAKCDWATSLNALQAGAPSVQRVNLFVSWFGNDLRAAHCKLYPAVTDHNHDDMPHAWGCAGFTRSTAASLSIYRGGAAYGGTPDDQSVIAAIKDLKARGLAVTFTPFISMDIPNGNSLPDPIAGGTGQAAYPWRGRITKQFATADKTSQVAVEVSAFVAQYRSFVLHYAQLCAAAGGVDAFVIGTELRGLTWLRDAPGSHPFVAALITLAQDVQAILPAAKLTYAADWSEWFGYQPADGSNDVEYHLDPLWASPAIAAIGIDNYMPLSDCRDTAPNIDEAVNADGTLRTIYDYDYLMGNVNGGEGYAWFYASSADRTSQIRTPITDGSYEQPWVFRYKDLWNWWSNQHYERPGGIRNATPTAWQPQSKPIWFTELGVPSADKGTNEPNVFIDPKSSESAWPYFSGQTADNLIQLRGINAWLKFFDPNDGAFTATNNPQSIGYAGRMVDLDHVTVYTWDARPYPWFPMYTGVWSDFANYAFGQWLAGKFSSYGNPATGGYDVTALANALAPVSPYITDPATGKINKQYADFFQAIQFQQASPIANVPLDATSTDIVNAINDLLAVLRAQNRIAST